MRRSMRWYLVSPVAITGISLSVVNQRSPTLVQAFPIEALFIAEHVSDRHGGVAQPQGSEQRSRLTVGWPVLPLHLPEGIAQPGSFDVADVHVARWQSSDRQAWGSELATGMKGGPASIVDLISGHW
jgi:hypothetical protein